MHNLPLLLPLLPLLLLLLRLPPTTALPFFDEALQPGSFHATSDAPLPWLTTATQDWQSGLPDATPIHHLSLPGTHDTGALHGGTLCETQAWSILEQLDAGIRYLDIRLRRFGDRFAIHHGVCFQKIFFAGVLEQLEAFLSEHTKEVVLMRVKEEHDPREGSKPFQSIWDRYMTTYKNLFMHDLSGRLPTLGDARGKIVVLRNAAFEGYGIKYDDTSIMDIQDWYKVYIATDPHPFGTDTASLTFKKSSIRQHLKKAAERHKLILNHWSCTNGLLPITCARATNADGNRALGPYTRPVTTGVIIMDYPGDRLIYRIIKTNFSSSKSCAARTWRALSDRTYAEFRMPHARLGSIHVVRKGAFHRFVFPKCHRATWSDLRFHCGEAGWVLNGQLDADGSCLTYNEKQRFVSVHHR